MLIYSKSRVLMLTIHRMRLALARALFVKVRFSIDMKSLIFADYVVLACFITAG